MNYARADGTIDYNPVDVLKFKRVDRSLRRKMLHWKMTNTEAIVEDDKYGI